MKDQSLKNSSLFSVERYRDEVAQRRVAVWHEADAHWRPIPVALSPTIIEKNTWDQLYRDARLIVGCFPKVIRWLQVMSHKDEVIANFFDQMLVGLSDCEIKLAKKSPNAYWGHASIRLDLFWHYGELRIIEANCTIPAMQAYSDNVLESWLLAGGNAAYRPQNVQQLLTSLVSLYRTNGGLSARPRIAILHRQGDSQLGELLWLAQCWTALGFESILVTPEKIERRGDLWLAEGIPCEIIYRHIFASRIKNEQILAALHRSFETHIYNPVSAHYESKAFFALLSHIAADEYLCQQVGIHREEALAIECRLPWCRVIGPSFAGVSLENVERRMDGLVIKRSVGYGGHSVVLGESWFSQETQNKLRTLTGISSDVDVKSFLNWLKKDDSMWVAQERMSGQQRKTKILTENGLDEWNAWFDASIFINSNGDDICYGGVSRIAKSPIVNIGTGGGLAPLVISP